MNGAKCKRCHKFWSFTANPELFEWITTWCPECLERAVIRKKAA